jgi:hypothetical protein
MWLRVARSIYNAYSATNNRWDYILQSSRIGIDEAIEDDSGKTQEEIQKEIVRKDTQARAQILEMVQNIFYSIPIK